jgi:hypothetical protein
MMGTNFPCIATNAGRTPAAETVTHIEDDRGKDNDQEIK